MRHGRQRRTLRVPLVVWNESLALRFELSFVPRATARARYGSPKIRGVSAQRIAWWDDGEEAATQIPRSGAAAEHLHSVAVRWAPWLEVRGGAIVETDEVCCVRCREWVDARRTTCRRCGQPVNEGAVAVVVKGET